MEYPLMTNYYSDIIRIERLHQKMREIMSLIYDNIICYLHSKKIALTAKITKISIFSDECLDYL